MASRDPPHERYHEALRLYLDDLENSSLVVVLLCGSLAHGTITEASDIDVQLVFSDGHPQGGDFREVSILGVRVQEFWSTETELLAGFAWEARSLSRQRSSLVAGGRVVWGDAVVGERLVQKASESLSAAVPTLDPNHARSLRNFIVNQFPSNTDRLIAASEPGFLMTWNGMMEKYFQAIHQLHGVLLPRHELIDNTLSSIPDRELGVAFVRALRAESLPDKRRFFYELSDLVRTRLDAFLEVTV